MKTCPKCGASLQKWVAVCPTCVKIEAETKAEKESVKSEPKKTVKKKGKK